MSNEKNKLFIGNLPWKATEDDLRPLFEAHGPVNEVKVVVDNYTGKSRGFAFVVMETSEGAQAAIENLDNTSVHGRDIRVSLAEDRRPREGGSREGGFQRREGGFSRDRGERDFSRERYSNSRSR